MTQRIAVDICNTLADINKLLTEQFGNIYQNPLITKQWFNDNHWIFREAEAFPYAASQLQMLAESGVEIYYCTDRQLAVAEITKKWLEVNGFPDGEILFTAAFQKSKADICLSLGIDTAIEDWPSNIDGYEQAGITCLVPKQPYNREYSNRFMWDEIANVRAAATIL